MFRQKSSASLCDKVRSFSLLKAAIITLASYNEQPTAMISRSSALVIVLHQLELLFPSSLFSKSRRSSSSFCLSLYSRNFRNHFEKTIHCLIPTPRHARKTRPPMIGMSIPRPAVDCDSKPIYAIIGTMMTDERTILIVDFLVKSS